MNPVDKLYYCFGCGKGGDIISFVRETENLDFVGAVEWLAERFRVPIEVEEASPHVEAERRRRERLYAVLDQTAGYFERLLWDGDAGAPVREYLAGRGLGEEVAKEFRLGLAPGRGLAEKAKERGFNLDELKSAGLVTTRGTDYFPQRLMFPLSDARGRVLGFQARKLREDDPLHGKYVNSPEGDLFHKGSILYGLHLAKTAIGKQDFAAVVEGNTDVIALRQAGFEPVVASMGTALTERQLRELGRLTKKLYLCFDADAAGQEATLRGMELAAGKGFDVKVVTLPRGQDPADAPEGFAERLQVAESYPVYRVRLELERAPDRQEALRASPRRALEDRVLARLRGCTTARSRTSSICRRRRSSGSCPTRLVARSGRRRAARGCWMQGTGSSATCSLHALRIPRSSAASPSSPRITSTPESNRRFRDVLVTGRDDPELTALARRARRARGAGGARRADRDGAPAPTPRAEAEARPVRRRSRADDGAAGAPREGASGASRADVAELAEGARRILPRRLRAARR